MNPADTDDIAAFRLLMWIELGFTAAQAETLLWAKGVTGLDLNHHDVKKLLDSGCTHQQIVDIFE